MYATTVGNIHFCDQTEITNGSNPRVKHFRNQKKDDPEGLHRSKDTIVLQHSGVTKKWQYFWVCAGLDTELDRHHGTALVSSAFPIILFVCPLAETSCKLWVLDVQPVIVPAGADRPSCSVVHDVLFQLCHRTYTSKCSQLTLARCWSLLSWRHSSRLLLLFHPPSLSSFLDGACPCSSSCPFAPCHFFHGLPILPSGLPPLEKAKVEVQASCLIPATSHHRSFAQAHFHSALSSLGDMDSASVPVHVDPLGPNGPRNLSTTFPASHHNLFLLFFSTNATDTASCAATCYFMSSTCILVRTSRITVKIAPIAPISAPFLTLGRQPYTSVLAPLCILHSGFSADA